MTVDSDLRQAKQPVSGALAGPYGHPFHPILVTIPIGAWVCSLVFDIAARFGPRPAEAGFAALWLIALGVVGAVAAACVGFLDFLAIPPQTPARRTASIHAILNLSVTGAYTANFFWRMNGDAGQPAGWGPAVLSVVSLIGLTASGYLGGKLAYHYGVRVAAETVQAGGFELRQRS